MRELKLVKKDDGRFYLRETESGDSGRFVFSRELGGLANLAVSSFYEIGSKKDIVTPDKSQESHGERSYPVSKETIAKFFDLYQIAEKKQAEAIHHLIYHLHHAEQGEKIGE